MKPSTKSNVGTAPVLKQRGVVLFFALIALLAMSLAAVALIRSVDTNTMIASNLAFKQSATTSGDAGIEFAINWLSARAAQARLANISTADPNHPLNIDQPALGYYSSANSAVSLTDGTVIQWTDADSSTEMIDGSGNKIRVIIQRMCPTPGVPGAGCLLGTSSINNGSHAIALGSHICAACPGSTSQSIQFRITARSEAPRNSISYVQAFAF